MVENGFLVYLLLPNEVKCELLNFHASVEQYQLRLGLNALHFAIISSLVFTLIKWSNSNHYLDIVFLL